LFCSYVHTSDPVGLDFFQLFVQSVIPYLRSLATDVHFEKCITKPYRQRHPPFYCSAVITLSKFKVIALHKFIQHSHCKVVQPFRLTSPLIKAFTTVSRLIFLSWRYDKQWTG